MRLHWATAPSIGSAAAEDELNQFLATYRALAVDRPGAARAVRDDLAIRVTYMDAGTRAGAAADANKKRVGYREPLPDAEFQALARLGDLRKQIAEPEGVPPYASFTNEQLADLVRHTIRTAADLARIDGVWPA